MEAKRIFGLVGPSGVGKGFIKEYIRKSLAETFSEPIVVTTRLERPSDSSDRVTGLSNEQFLDMLSQGEILFAHRPFGENSHWYGFVASSFSGEKPVMTEVHVDNVRIFREKFLDGLLLIALIADLGYLASNMEQRGDTSHEIKERLTAATDEVTAIRLLHQERLIDHIIAVNIDNRDTLADVVINLLLRHIKIC